MSDSEIAVNDGIQTRPLSGGNVEILFIRDGEEIVRAVCTSTETSALVSGLLNAAHHASDHEEVIDKPERVQPLIKTAVPATQWFLGTTNVSGQKSMAVKVGDCVTGFVVAEENMRELGRQLTAAAWRSRSTARSIDLLSRLFVEFCEDLRAWSALAGSRVTETIQRHRILLWRWFIGRSFRPVRTVKFAPDEGHPEYAPAGRCVYCGAKDYSDEEGVRKHPLGAEHIVAEGLGGKLKLPQSSCRKCEATTGALVENDVLSITLKALRVHLKIRGKRPLPRILPLTLTDVTPERTVQVDAEDYPIVLGMPSFGEPAVFSGGPGGNQNAAGFLLVSLHYDQKRLHKKYGITSFATARWDTHMLFRMLGKIGHSFAMAELGGKFKPLLVDMILNGTPTEFNHIGGDQYLSSRRSEHLHEIALGYQRSRGKDYVVANIRLFARYGGPVYSVVVGEALESSFRKFRRSLLGRFRKPSPKPRA